MRVVQAFAFISYTETAAYVDLRHARMYTSAGFRHAGVYASAGFRHGCMYASAGLRHARMCCKKPTKY